MRRRVNWIWIRRDGYTFSQCAGNLQIIETYSARNSRIISEWCIYTARARSLARHIRQCNTPSIERQYEAAYLSLFLLLSRAHFYERIHRSQTTDRVSTALTGFFLFSPVFLSFLLFLSFSSILAHGPLIFHSPPSASPSPLQARLSLLSSIQIHAEKKIERCRSIRVKVKESPDGSKYFHTRCDLDYSQQTSRAPRLLDEVESSCPMDIVVKQNTLTSSGNAEQSSSALQAQRVNYTNCCICF